MAGIIMLIFPPKDINNVYGYRTRRSKSGKRAWDFAQKYSALRLIESGALGTISGVLVLVFQPNISFALYLSLTFTLLAVCIANTLFRTEAQLKKRRF